MCGVFSLSFKKTKTVQSCHVYLLTVINIYIIMVINGRQKKIRHVINAYTSNDDQLLMVAYPILPGVCLSLRMANTNVLSPHLKVMKVQTLATYQLFTRGGSTDGVRIR